MKLLHCRGRLGGETDKRIAALLQRRDGSVHVRIRLRRQNQLQRVREYSRVHIDVQTEFTGEVDQRRTGTCREGSRVANAQRIALREGLMCEKPINDKFQRR